MEQKTDDPAKLDESHVALRELRSAGQIGDHDYFKALTTLAARWVLLGRNEDAISLLCELPPDWVRVSLPWEMQEDPGFGELALSVAEVLSRTLPDLDEDDVRLALMLVERPAAKA